ncbi:MAG: penicillin-binding transpeptidase domain-containing protein [Bowdeniella nasicola]|nr:penicillin-binding transpeptidase domain-containing protein [Bowdeniella nasicola]
MNRPLRRLAVVMAMMFLALLLSSTTIQFFQAPTLNADGRNVREIYREYGRDRGPIIVAGEPIVSSEPVDDVFKYQRTYLQGPLYAPVTGYFATAFNSATGLEKSESAVLNGTAPSLLVSRMQDLVIGRQPKGGSIELTINPRAQQAAWDALGDDRGAVVALRPSTGEILALVSKPSFDPNRLATHDQQAAQDAWKQLNDDAAKPLANRATGTMTFAPGSVFKVITAAAWLEKHGGDADQQVPTDATFTLPGSESVLHNPGKKPCGPSDKGPLRFAFAHSCNTTFARLAIDVGSDDLRAQAEAFGFGEKLTSPLPVAASELGEITNDAQLAMSGIGQFEVQSHPLQMAMVAAAVANRGILMEPQLVKTVRDADLQEISQFKPRELREPISATTAATLTELMRAVVTDGTGRPLALEGVEVAAKTGTAQTDTDLGPHAWVIAFAPKVDADVAVAVVVEHGGHDGQRADGGMTAGPIAKRVIEAVLTP